MPRYFFNFLSDELALLDDEGIELTDTATVREYAAKRAADLAAGAHKIKNRSGWRIQIRDEKGDDIISMACHPDNIEDFPSKFPL